VGMGDEGAATRRREKEREKKVVGGFKSIYFRRSTSQAPKISLFSTVRSLAAENNKALFSSARIRPPKIIYSVVVVTF
jgi:hypothetical protein